MLSFSLVIYAGVMSFATLLDGDEGEIGIGMRWVSVAAAIIGLVWLEVAGS